MAHITYSDNWAGPVWRRSQEFASRFEEYSSYSTTRAYIERISAFVKNLLIVLSHLWLKWAAFFPFPLQPIKLSNEEQRESTRRGTAIWAKLAGANTFEKFHSIL